MARLNVRVSLPFQYVLYRTVLITLLPKNTVLNATCLKPAFRHRRSKRRAGYQTTVSDDKKEGIHPLSNWNPRAETAAERPVLGACMTRSSTCLGARRHREKKERGESARIPTTGSKPPDTVMSQVSKACRARLTPGSYHYHTMTRSLHACVTERKCKDTLQIKTFWL